MSDPLNPKWILLLDVVKLLHNPKFSWTEKPELKYLNLRIDTRDNHCVLTNDFGNEVSLTELESACQASEGYICNSNPQIEITIKDQKGQTP